MLEQERVKLLFGPSRRSLSCSTQTKFEYLRELLGHKDLKMIRKHYGHLFDESAALHGVLADMKML